MKKYREKDKVKSINDRKLRYVAIKGDYIRDGMINDIGVVEFTVLFVIASHSNGINEARISQRKLSEITGLSLPTVNKVVNKLLHITINEEFILKREKDMESKRHGVVYRLNQNIVNMFY